MRKGILILGMLCSLLSLANPVRVHAADSEGERISIRYELPAGGEFSPGDTVERSFRILNPNKEAVKVRMDSVENPNGSDLFSVVQVRWNGEESFHALSDSERFPEWFEIGANEEKLFHVSLHFPEEAGNEYQGSDLLARIRLECRYAKEGAVSDEHPSLEINDAADTEETGQSAVRTGDVSDWVKPLVMLVISALCFFCCFRKREEKLWREDEK